MAIPDFETLMLPLLQHTAREATEVLTEKFNLTEQEQKKLLPSGTIRVIVNRAGWACELIDPQHAGWGLNHNA